ncbi:MAG TPA: DUF4190 domain-containing protein [Actinomycetes bacterium]|nr:DUF4190 domain-containing protein [Actinomycetes bacterium]
MSTDQPGGQPADPDPWRRPDDEGSIVPPPPPGPYPPPTPGGGYQWYPTPPTNSGKAIAVLVLGIVGLLFVCGYGLGVVPAIVALAMAPSAKREIEASGGTLTGEGMIKAGVVCSWVAVGIAAVGLVLIVIVVVAAAVGSSALEGGTSELGGAGVLAATAFLPQWRRARD